MTDGVTPYREFGRALERAMRSARMKQVELAQRVSIHQTYVSKLKRGESQPDIEIVQAMAEALHADFDELASLAGYVVPSSEDRVVIPGWHLLTAEQQAGFRATIAAVAAGRQDPPRQVGPAAT